MIGLALALLAAMALLHFAQAETAGAYHSVGRAQSYATARSAIDAIAGRLAEQREEILAGHMPRVDEQYVMYEVQGRTGVARLLPVGAHGALIESESCKLDFNDVTAEQLVATGLVEEELANRIIQFRDKALTEPIRSLNELADVPGMTNELLFGPLERLQESCATVISMSEDGSTRPSERRSDRALPIGFNERDRALIDVLTVYSIEADVRMDDTARIDLSAAQVEPAAENESPAVREENLEAELDPDIPSVLRPLVARGTTFAKASEIAVVLRENNIPPEEWPEIFEVCTTHAGALRHGRLDINTASVEALLAIPGFTVELAEAIASAQETLSDAERSTVCWPLMAGIIEAEPFSEALDHITNRSWCYRVRIAAGEVSSDEPHGSIEAPVIFEVVFDLASQTPRVAYLRDITLLPTMLTLAHRHSDDGARFEDRMESHALDDEIAAWDEAFSDEEPADDEDAGSDGRGLPSRPSLPDTLSIPDRPTLPTSLREPSTEDSTSETPSTQPSNESGDSPSAQQTAPVRRIGRWRSGSAT